jgi:hypothetical protein
MCHHEFLRRHDDLAPRNWPSLSLEVPWWPGTQELAFLVFEEYFLSADPETNGIILFLNVCDEDASLF